MKKNRWGLILSGAVLLILMTACQGSGSDSDSISENSEQLASEETSVATSSLKDGTYEASSQGYGGEVSLRLVIEESKVTEAIFTGENETAGIGQAALPDLESEIIEKQSADIDSVSGATITSKAAIEAAAEAFASAGGEEQTELPELEMEPGTYQGSAQGYSGTLVVDVTVSEDRIENIEFVESIAKENDMIDKDFWASYYALSMLNDTPQILKTVTDVYPERIVEYQSLALDAVTGATSSSNGFKEAVKDAVSQAGGEPDAFNRTIEKSTEKLNYDADVVVIGGGTAGSAAAASAAENGAKVILIEKSGRIGGTGSLSSTPMTLNSEMQKEAGNIVDEDAMYEAWMEATNYSSKGAIVRTFLSETANTSEWLMENGFELKNTMMGNNPESAHLTDREFANAQLDYVGDAIGTMDVANYFKELVSDVDTILYETTANSLIQNNDGAIVGVLAERWDGASVTITAKKVIVATGGIAGNAELMEKYNGSGDYEVFGLHQNTGDGLTIMTQAGASEFNIGGMAGHLTDVAGEVEGYNIYDTSIPYTLSITPTLLKVNARGERFMNENEKTLSMTGSTTYALANGSYNYTLISEKQLNALRESGLSGTGMDTVPAGAHFFLQPLEPDYVMSTIDAVLESGEEIGLTYSGEGLGELAEKTDMDYETLEANVVRYNELAKNGEDLYFNKEAKYLDELGDIDGKWWAIKSVPLVYSALGGVDIDENFRVLDDGGQVIDGLYAAGMDSFGVINNGVAYPDFKGEAVGWGFTSGRLSGQHAAQELAKQDP